MKDKHKQTETDFVFNTNMYCTCIAVERLSLLTRDQEHCLNQQELSYKQTDIHNEKTETSSDYRALMVQTA